MTSMPIEALEARRLLSAAVRTLAAAEEFPFDIQLRFRDRNLNAAQRSVFQQAAERWEQIITSDLPDARVGRLRIDDLLIDVYADTVDGIGGILGGASPLRVRPASGLPYTGYMVFDAADVAGLHAEGALPSVILHEMAHVLGFGSLWENFGLVAGSGTANPVYVGANGVKMYNALFGGRGLSVPLENAGGAGTAESHWREKALHNEIGTGWLNGGVNPLSRVTIASLADLGYTVNYAAADPYPYAAQAKAARAAAPASVRSPFNTTRLIAMPQETALPAAIWPPAKPLVSEHEPARNDSLASIPSRQRGLIARPALAVL